GRHQLCSRLLIHLPEAGDNHACTGIQEAPRHADKALAIHLFSERRLTSAQHNKLSLKIRIENVCQAVEACFRLSVFAYKRKNKTRKVCVLGIEKAMRRKVQNAAAANSAATHCCRVGIE